MNTITQKLSAIAIAVIATASGATPAPSADATEEPISRAEVVREREVARTDGWLAAMSGEDSGSAWLSAQPVAAGRTRAQVLAEAAAARASGELLAMQGEDSGSAFMALRQHGTGTLYAGPNFPAEPSSTADATTAG